jgi:tetratricopeptide (TPR) repeat protein
MENILRRPAPTPSTLPDTDTAQAFSDKETASSPETTSLVAGGKRAEEDLTEDLTVVRADASRDARKEEEASGVSAVTHKRRNAESSAQKRTTTGARRMWQLAALALLVVAIGAAALAFYYSRGTGSGARDAQGTGPISISDQQRLVEEKLSEAESLLSAGNVTDAIARLRYAIRLEPSNARAHRLLAEALERTGAVNEAIDEYRAAAQYDPNNEETQLRYADALRRVGRTDEARDIYQKLSSSGSAEVSRTAKEQLSTLPPANASNSEAARDARSQNRPEENGTNTSAAASSPGTTGAGGPTTATNNDGAGRPKNDPVASYNTALRIIEGKDIRKMNRAELIRAYELFQYAQTGPRAADANRHLRELDKELFERRKRKQ